MCVCLCVFGCEVACACVCVCVWLCSYVQCEFLVRSKEVLACVRKHMLAKTSRKLSSMPDLSISLSQ